MCWSHPTLLGWRFIVCHQTRKRQRNLCLASNYCYLFILLDTKLSSEPRAVTKGIDNFYQKCHNYRLYGGLGESVSEWNWRHSSLALIVRSTRELNYIAVKTDHLACWLTLHWFLIILFVAMHRLVTAVSGTLARLMTKLLLLLLLSSAVLSHSSTHNRVRVIQM